MHYEILNEVGFVRALLTSDSPSSRYGIPVLRIERPDRPSRDLGPKDRLTPNLSLTAACLVCSWARNPLRDPSEKRAARLFCGQWPDGPQP